MIVYDSCLIAIVIGIYVTTLVPIVRVIYVVYLVAIRDRAAKVTKSRKACF